jgi:hypothetical protein
MSWVEEVKRSIPAYASNVAAVFEDAMNPSILDQVDAHACALAAACAVSNGGLAYEISMNGVLFGRDERDIAKTAVVDIAMLDLYYYSISKMGGHDYPELLLVEKYTAAQETKLLMYSLAAKVALKSEFLDTYYRKLIAAGITHQETQEIVKIASVIAAINKIVA